MDLSGWISEFGGMHGSYFSRNYYVMRNKNFVSNMKKYMDSCDNSDVYQCAYSYENTEFDTCRIIGDPYLDFDCEHCEDSDEWSKLVYELKYSVNYIETAMGIPVEELRLYFSGSKGFHLIIPAECVGIKPGRALNEEFKLFALGMSYIQSGKNVNAVKIGCLDLGIYDRRRLFRIPNTINKKSGVYKVPISIDQLYTPGMSRKDMLEWGRQQREEKYDTPRFRAISMEGYQAILAAGIEYEKLENPKRMRRVIMRVAPDTVLDLLPCTKELMATAVSEGNRNVSCFALASSLLQAGYGHEDVLDMVDTWNEKNDPPLPDREILVTVNSAIQSYESGMMVGCGKYRELNLCVDNCRLLLQE